MKRLIVVAGIALWMIACAGKENTKADPKGDAAAVDGGLIFKKYCVLCHGVDGKLGLNGAKDITISPLTKAERIALIKHGKNLMTPFEGTLSEAEIEAVAEYTLQLK